MKIKSPMAYSRIITTFTFLLLLIFHADAAHFYVTAAGGSSPRTGADWAHAWTMADLNSSWGSVSGGDTVWLAGGTDYTTALQPAVRGSSGNYVYIKRIMASDTGNTTGVSGWNAGFL